MDCGLSVGYQNPTIEQLRPGWSAFIKVCQSWVQTIFKHNYFCWELACKNLAKQRNGMVPYNPQGQTPVEKNKLESNLTKESYWCPSVAKLKSYLFHPYPNTFSLSISSPKFLKICGCDSRTSCTSESKSKEPVSCTDGFSSMGGTI